MSSTPALAADDASTRRVRAIVDEHYEFVWRSLRGLGVPRAALDDDAQRVFWLAAQKIDVIAVGSERPFLFRLATGIAANERRTLRRRRELSDDQALQSYADSAPNPEESASREQARRLIHTILGSFPEDLRMVFVLFELEELDLPGIAACLEIPVGTAASRLRRAREKFHAALEHLRQQPRSRGIR